MKINFVELLKSYGVKALAGLTGWRAALVNFILNKLLKALKKAWDKALVKLAVNKEIKEELKKYEEAINKPGATEEEIRNAGRDFIK